MTGTRRNLLVACGMLMLASPVLGCVIPHVSRAYFQDPMLTETDGSFTANVDLTGDTKNWSERYFRMSYVEGGRVNDLKNSLVGQRVTYVIDGSPNQNLLVVNCETAESILIRGTEERFGEDTTCPGYGFFIDNIQRPKGPISFSADTTIDSLERIAVSEGYTYTRDVIAKVRELPRSKRYDPFFGCKLFYPDSEGAKQKL